VRALASAFWSLVSAVSSRSGGDLLFRGLSRSTIGAEGFHGRVRDGIGCGPLAVATRPARGSVFCPPLAGAGEGLHMVFSGVIECAAYRAGLVDRGSTNSAVMAAHGWA
jgi:hypothetical protein